jgi:hypothetical protein
MTVEDLEKAVASLKANELEAFARWFQEYLADAWDERIARDAISGRLDHLGQKADEDFEAGRCTPL